MASDTRIISGKAYWAAIVEPNTTFEPVWSVDITLDEKTKAIVEKDGLTVKNKGDDRGEFVTLKRKVMKKDGTKRNGPSVKDSRNQPWGDQLVGNGSQVNVKYQPFEWKYAGKAGMSADLMAIQVVDLVPYTKDDFSSVDGGYTQAQEGVAGF